MRPLSRVRAPGRLLLAGAVLSATQGVMGSEKRTITIGATVVTASKCQVDASAGSRCSGNAPAPQMAAASPSSSRQAQFQGQLLVNVSASAASLDSRNALAPPLEPVVLTITP